MPAEDGSKIDISPEQQPPLTTADVAKRFRVGRSTVVRWADEGLIPCFTTLKGHRRFRPEDVERLTTARPATKTA